MATLRGVAGPHPFLAKIKDWYFSKLLKHRVAYDQLNFSEFFQQCWVTLRGVEKLEVWYFSKFCLHGVAYDLER